MKSLLLLLSFLPVALADNWEDFTNNLATDLAPLLTLFGEQLTKQFLSESINLLDHFIFALAPLGVITAVISVIRVCGSPSLKAFIGRAQEGPAQAENELLPCVSDSTAELFNDGGISRVFGQPKILELVAWENEDPATGQVSVEFGTLRDALKSGAWGMTGPRSSSQDLQDLLEGSELDVPNLSLNKGIRRRSQPWFYLVAAAGVILQAGVVVYAALTVFTYPGAFQVNGSTVPNYAFPLFTIGTVFLFIGIFYSAILVGRSSKNYTLVPQKTSRIYWLQPGDQKVGDQVFSAFLAAKEGDSFSMTYIKSTRAGNQSPRWTDVSSAVLTTVVGFIFQFIGQRGLHASVILAQLGATMAMSIFRTCLRTQRMKEDQNLIRDDRKLASFKQQELDSFAFYLEQICSFSPSFKDIPDTPTTSQLPHDDSLVHNLINTRKQIASLTKCSTVDLSLSWDDFPIRTAAMNLAKAMERTMELINIWGAGFDKTFDFQLVFDCQSRSPKAQTQSRGVRIIQLSNRGGSLRWKTDSNELEAILGLWVWSLYKDDTSWQRNGQKRRPLVRIVGSDETESRRGENYLSFQKWVLRQTEPEHTSCEAIDTSKRRFGYDPRISDPDDILTMRTTNELELMAAQDIFGVFLKAAVRHIERLSEDVDVVPGVFNSWIVAHSQIDTLVQCFEDCQLGSREDALLCIISIVQEHGLLPYLASDSKSVRDRTEALVQHRDWKTAFSLHRWLCQRSAGLEFERSVFELGFLCRRALLHSEKFIQEEGYKQLCELLDGDIRLPFMDLKQQPEFRRWVMSTDRAQWWQKFSSQLGWAAWAISLKVPHMEWIQAKLRASDAPRYSNLLSSSPFDQERTQVGIQTLQDWLGCRKEDYGRIEYEGNYVGDDEAALLWAIHGSHDALLYWTILLWIDLSSECPNLIAAIWILLVKHRSTWMLNILRERGIGINAVSTEGRFALLYPMVEDPPDVDGVRFLLDHGASPDGSDEMPDKRPLIIASGDGFEEVAELLVTYGATIELADKIGLTALYWACSNNHLNVARLLLSRGANMNSTPHGETTPLMAAISEKNIAMVKLLIEYGCDVNFQGEHEYAPLAVAIIVGFNLAIPFLLSHGADPEKCGPDGRSIVDFAGEIGNGEAVQILKRGILPEGSS